MSAEASVALDSVAGRVSFAQYQRIPNVWLAVMEIVIFVAVEVVVWCPIRTTFTRINSDPPFPLLCLLHAFVWAAVALLNRVMQYNHRVSRHNGYLSFYRKTRAIRKIPFAALSGGNAILLAVSVLMEPVRPASTLSRLNVLQIVVTVEFLVCVSSVIFYLYRLTDFNRTPSAPDALHVVDSTHLQQQQQQQQQQHRPANNMALASQLASASLSTHSPALVPYSADDNFTTLLIERQADLITHLQSRNDSLAHRLLDLADSR